MITCIFVCLRRFHPIHALVFVRGLSALEIELEGVPRTSGDGLCPVEAFVLFFSADGTEDERLLGNQLLSRVCIEVGDTPGVKNCYNVG